MQAERRLKMPLSASLHESVVGDKTLNTNENA
jgi:hypothetical protein